MPPEWRDGICWAVLELSGPWRLAFDTMLPDADIGRGAGGERFDLVFARLRASPAGGGRRYLTLAGCHGVMRVTGNYGGLST